MILAAFFMVFLTFPTSYGAKAKANCDHLGTLLYEDLGCTPTYKQGQKCPVSYDCKLNAKNNTCVFRGRTIQIGEGINDNETLGECRAGCFCSGTNEMACAILDCFDDATSLPGVQQECYSKYQLGKCCRVGEICPTIGNPLYQCSVDGEQIREGQRFFPKQSCSRCICSKDYKGKNVPPFCERIRCLAQADNSKQTSKYCAPYYGVAANETTLCCPNQWVCPTLADKSLPSNPKITPDSNLTCRFGSKKLQLGERLQSTLTNFADTTTNVQCECILPPLLTCRPTLSG